MLLWMNEVRPQGGFMALFGKVDRDQRRSNQPSITELSGDAKYFQTTDAVCAEKFHWRTSWSSVWLGNHLQPASRGHEGCSGKWTTNRERERKWREFIHLMIFRAVEGFCVGSARSCSSYRMDPGALIPSKCQLCFSKM